MTAYGIDFIDEDDARSVLLALLKEITNAARAYADEHLYEVGSGDGEERDVRLAGNCTSQQGVTRARRPHEPHALRNAAPQVLKLLRHAQQLNNVAPPFPSPIHP